MAILTLAIGSGTAWLVTAFRFPGSRALAWLLPLPLAVPTYVTALVYVEILDAAGPIRTALRSNVGRTLADTWFPEVRSLGGCILLFAFVLYPYVFIAARAAFVARDPALLAAARTLGARPFRLFLRIALPLARPALAAGVALVLLETLNDIGATEYLGVRTLTLSAYVAWLNRGDFPAAAQIACLVLVLVLLLLAAEAALRRRAAYAGSPASARRAEPQALHGGPAVAALLACSLPVLLGLVVPAGFLVLEVLRRDLVALTGAAVTTHLATTLALSGVATAIVLVWAVPIVLGARAGPGRLHRPLAGLAGLGYAVPGTVLVLGLFAPLVAADRLLGGLWEAASGRAAGLILVGSGAGIVVAYVIRFMRIATASLAAQLEASPRQVEDVARTLGARPWALAIRIQLPILRPAVGGAALLVFVDCLKELPATLLLRPLNVETLATLVYGAASRGMFEEGALAALVIVAAGIGPIVWLTRAMAVGPQPATARRLATAAAADALTPPSAPLRPAAS